MKLALIIIGSICLTGCAFGIYISCINKGVRMDWKTFAWGAVGTTCLIFGFCINNNLDK